MGTTDFPRRVHSVTGSKFAEVEVSDMSKALRTAVGYRWVILSTALLLTVVTGVLGWNEIATDGSPAPRALVQGIAGVAWIAFLLLCVGIAVIRAVTKTIHRAKQDVLQAICERRLGALADLMEEDNVRTIQKRK